MILRFARAVAFAAAAIPFLTAAAWLGLQLVPFVTNNSGGATFSLSSVGLDGAATIPITPVTILLLHDSERPFQKVPGVMIHVP
jgi:hypothetical protein